MATTNSDLTINRVEGPIWAGWIGAIVVILGIYASADHGIEAMKQYMFVGVTSAQALGDAFRCPPDELVEEGISQEVCEQMSAMLRSQLVSRPTWFGIFKLTVECSGLVLALFSILVGIALVDWHSWAPAAAVGLFGAFTALNIVNLIAVLNTGPLLRAQYLWSDLLWILVHLSITAAALAGKREMSARRTEA